MFGPLFYTTAVVAVVLVAIVQFEVRLPAVTEWIQQRSLVGSLRAHDSAEREAAAATLIRSATPMTVPPHGRSSLWSRTRSRSPIVVRFWRS